MFSKITKLVAIIATVLTIQSCSKSSDSTTTPVVIPTQLKVGVTDNLGYPLSGATVILYASQSDYTNKTNPVATTTTDVDGYMNFSGLQPIIYYFSIQSGCMDNYNRSYHSLATPLTANKINTYAAIKLTQEGVVKFVNTSTNPYELFIDGNVVYSSLQGGYNYTLYEMPAGSHTYEVKQLSGYLFTPTDETGVISVYCGSTSTITFP